MIILMNKWGGGTSQPQERRQSTGLIALSPQTSMRGGQRQNKGGDSRG